MRSRWLFVNRESIAHIVSTTHTHSTTPHTRTNERMNEREGVLANVSFLYSDLDSIYNIIYLVNVFKEGKFSFKKVPTKTLQTFNGSGLRLNQTKAYQNGGNSKWLQQFLRNF